MNTPHPPKPASKPHQASGISSAETTQLRTRVERLEKEVLSLNTQLNEKNSWAATVRSWVGSDVCVRLVDQHEVVGKLAWIDRYTLCVEGAPPSANGLGVRPLVIHKACIVLMYLKEEPKKES